MKRSVIKAMLASGFLLLGTNGWAQTAAQRASEDNKDPSAVHLSVSPKASEGETTIAGWRSTAKPDDPTRQESLFLHIQGLGEASDPEQVSELFYGFEGIYNDGGMQIIGLKGDTKAVFAHRIQYLRNHPMVKDCQLDEFGNHLYLRVQNLSMASILDIIINSTSDQK
jgi:hypothetical protein